jgi:hypothetical protein
VNAGTIPLRSRPLLLLLCKITLRLVVRTMSTLWHQSIALDFLLPAHIAGLNASVHFVK